GVEIIETERNWYLIEHWKTCYEDQKNKKGWKLGNLLIKARER
ncbi:unnamed protein product, partial [Allacma fusca]